jgi:Putative transposase of IS4/5 family (DUF4096)
MKRSYATDLTDAEWEALEPHVPAPNKRGRPRTHTPREILNAVFYVLKSGCPWRLLPRDFPPWETVSTGGLADGAWMGPSSISTPRCANGCGAAWVGTRSLARGYRRLPVLKDDRSRR